MSVREDVRVLDATLRDGGLVNDFYFTDDFVYDLYKANLAAGVDYMEFGYRADKKQFDVNKFGKWKYEDFHYGGCGTLRLQTQYQRPCGQPGRSDPCGYLYQHDA